MRVFAYDEGFHIDERGRIRGNHIHYNRRRWCATKDGGKVHAMTTRYCWQMARRHAMGGKALEEHPRYVYYLDGRFYRNERVQVLPNQWANVIVPLDGTMWDVHPRQSAFEGVPDARITCEDGWPVSVTMDGVEFDGGWQECEDTLCIMRKRRAKTGPKALA